MLSRDALRRPLTARSVVASVLLGTRPPVLPVSLIVATTELFGISAGATRVALSRMVAAGELEADNGHYRLAGHLIERQARQEQSRRPHLGVWTGSWVLAVVPPGGRTAPARADLRSQLVRARLAELREGVWCRPDNLTVALPAWLVVWSARPSTPLPADLWDLDAWSATAHELLGAMAEGVDDLGTAFVTAASVLRHLQADPLLPPQLLADDWPGAALRTRYEAYEEAFQARLGAWFRSHR